MHRQLTPVVSPLSHLFVFFITPNTVSQAQQQDSPESHSPTHQHSHRHMQQEPIDQQSTSPTPTFRLPNTDPSTQDDHDLVEVNIDIAPDSIEDGASLPASIAHDEHPRSRGGKRSPAFKGKRLTSGNQGNGSSKWKGKRRAAAADPDGAWFVHSHSSWSALKR